MNNALAKYSYILEEYLSCCFANQQSINPVCLNKERFRVKAVFIISVIFLKYNTLKKEDKIVYETNHWLKKTFANENLFSSIIDSSSNQLIKLVNENLSDLIGAESIDIPTIYEILLGIETGNEHNGAVVSTAKNYRNKLGSYYTPASFAKAVTKKSIDIFLKLNFGNCSKVIENEISSITFADFSCGGGNFIIAIIDYFETIFTEWSIKKEKQMQLLKMVALNISAFDVDCVALEVAKLNLLLRIKQPNLYNSLSQTFIHANFLLQSDSEIDDSKKVEIFSSGFIYHEKLGLHRDKLKKYDVILGNPPWEKIRFEEKSFYALYSKMINDSHFKSNRTDAIAKIELNNFLLAEYSKKFKTEIEKSKLALKRNPFFTLSSKGELNTYALFTDAAINLKTQKGVIGLVLKSAIVTSQVNKNLFKYITINKYVIAIYDFINRKKIFNIDSRERFCFLLLGNAISESFCVSMNLTDFSEIEKIDSEIKLSHKSLKLLNPVTGMLPNFSNKKEADFLLRVSFDFQFFKNVYSHVKFGRIVHLTNHAEYISRKKSEDNIPIYEGKFFNQFDGKYSGFNGVSDQFRYGNKSSSVNLANIGKMISDCIPEARFFINDEKWRQISKNHNEKFMLAWRSLTSATNTRTCIATVLPFVPAAQSVQFLTTNQNDLLYLSGLFNSIVFDFILKKKLSGIDLTQSVINQVPVPGIEQISSKIYFNGCIATIKNHISMLVFSLLRDDVRLSPLFENLELAKGFNIESKFATVRKIDLLFIALYKLTELEAELVIAEFNKQYSKDDLGWFKNELREIYLNESISPTRSLVPHLSPT